MAHEIDSEKMKSRRVTIDLTPAAASEVDRLREVTGLTTADVFRHALTLFRVYVDAKVSGQDVELVDKNHGGDRVRIEVPVPISTRSR